jgi:ABC-type bacteriocin/lantibiotic exporter with double-glycine peptidase domain
MDIQIKEIWESIFNLKILEFARETREMMHQPTLDNTEYLVYLFCYAITRCTSNHMKYISENGLINLAFAHIFAHINKYLFRNHIDTSKEILTTFKKSSDTVFRKIDIQMQHYYSHPQHSALLHQYYNYSMSHHIATENLLFALAGISYYITSMFTRPCSLFKRAMICAFMNSVFSDMENSISISTEKSKETNDIELNNSHIISEFLANQNVIYGCMKENDFLNDIKENYKKYGELSIEYHPCLMITNESLKDDIQYNIKMATLRTIVELDMYDTVLLSNIDWYLHSIYSCSKHLRNVNISLNNLDLSVLDRFVFEDIPMITCLDYNYDLFTIQEMEFRFNPSIPLLRTTRVVSIPANKWVYFQGNSGTGKTTFIQLLLKMIANDDISFFQHSKYDMKSIRNSLLFMKSTGDIFERESIEYNISFGIPNPSVDMIEYYFKLFELGSYQDVKDREIGLMSTGEKQRIRIIHSILYVMFDPNKRILIFDEITSNIDESTEQNILDELKRLQIKHNLSVIHISHRSSHCRLCDYLMTIKDTILNIEPYYII